MINFDIPNGRFNFRVAGLIFDSGRVLIHRLKCDDFYALPGGRVEAMESTETTLIREMQEELNITVKTERLLWVGEQFFHTEGTRFHEICFYYLLKTADPNLRTSETIFETTEDGREYEFKWVELDKLKNENFYPAFMRTEITNLPEHTEKFVEVDNVLQEGS
ncbi:MAG: NUDIX hydrolase [Defluviitaleaceae bacterium]|nr:NUDIX hydrolase [Defluviitaleaceae bacterium]MCL2263649.1 NUDIX hydrolase [Defluviitaleaceae bacterium]MCL2263882.1 NUDIX hydrolase [Defluviitaleaceae bacterium]